MVISDGVVTEVLRVTEDTALEGVAVVIGEQHDAGDADSAETTNPFAPKFPSHGGRK